MPARLAPATVAILLGLLTASARAADSAGAVVERTYDVRDLAIPILDFNDAPELGIEKPQPPAPAGANAGDAAKSRPLPMQCRSYLRAREAITIQPLR